jgi:hypothetical protein
MKSTGPKSAPAGKEEEGLKFDNDLQQIPTSEVLGEQAMTPMGMG